MSVAVITGSAGLVGSEAARHFSARGMTVVGIDNDLRRTFFGEGASTAWNRRRLQRRIPSYVHEDFDIRDDTRVDAVFRTYAHDIALVIHTAAQPSHEWAARDPVTDFGVNATGTLNLLEATRRCCPAVPFIFTSTNKVYGDTPNRLPLVELDTRWDLEESHPAHPGIAEDMSIDRSQHTLFGASKLAADVLVQEYGRYFGMKTVSFRAGCISGPGHAGAPLHGFLAYLMQCTVTGQPYTVLGHKGKQVRDNIHATDLVAAFDAYVGAPRPGEVYNIGGGRRSHCSMQEAITLCEEIAGRPLTRTYSARHRTGDHAWYVSDLARFTSHYPEWDIRRGVREILQDIYETNAERWAARA